MVDRVEKAGYVVWTIAFIELIVLVFLPAIKLWVAN